MTEFDIGDFPWPSASQDLLSTSGPWTGHALLGWQRGIVLGRAEGFKCAADVLVGHVLTSRSDLDFLIFPIANNWRHSLELRLKALVAELRELFDSPAKDVRGHDLMKLWREARVGLEKAHPSEATDDLDHAGRLLNQLHGLDPDGQNFRYHRRTDGALSLDGVDRLDIRALHDGLTAVSNLLGGAIDQIDYDLAIKRELEREIERDYGP